MAFAGGMGGIDPPAAEQTQSREAEAAHDRDLCGAAERFHRAHHARAADPRPGPFVPAAVSGRLPVEAVS